MFGFGNHAAEPEHATAPIAVWWDMKGCPIPEGYDARRVRPSIEAEFKKLGYSGPVSITAYADHKQTPCQLLRGLSSTGVDVAHTKTESICSLMYSNMLEWRAQNPPPATMMLISDSVEHVFSWDLARLQQVTMYNLFLAYSEKRRACSKLVTSAVWLWNELLDPGSGISTESCSAAMFYCKSCSFHGQSVEGFRKHLSSRKHAVQEVLNPTHPELDHVTRKWGKNYAAEPEYATAPVGVWWDMNECPIPKGYDARQVRPSIEAAFKKLGYSGPVSITAYGDHKQTPDEHLRGLSSTGVALAQTIPEVIYKRMDYDMREWRDQNPPPATMMLITDSVEDFFSHTLVRRLQQTKYKLCVAYSSRPYKMSVLVTCAEWLWESLLAETTRHLLRKCSGSSERGGEMFYCRLCFCDCKSLDDFRNHLSTDQHQREDRAIRFAIERNYYNQKQCRKAETLENFPKSKRLRRAYRTGFGHLHNHLRLTHP